MKIRKSKIEGLIDQLDTIARHAKKAERRYESELGKVHVDFRASAANLLHYLALRRHDIHDLQARLGDLGLSRLGRAEAHVLASVFAIKRNLGLLVDRKKPVDDKVEVGIRHGARRLKANTNALLGKKLKGSKARIMVTLPREAGFDRNLVHHLLSSGMNCARINCAHDDPDVWASMIANIRWARKKTGRSCKVCMDLGGPKLRTGPLTPGPRVLHVAPLRDDFGAVVKPGLLRFAAADGGDPASGTASVPGEWVASLAVGAKIRFVDARNKRCQATVVAVDDEGAVAESTASVYITPGTRLTATGARRSVAVETVAPVDSAIVLRMGDRLVLHCDPAPGEGARFDALGQVLAPAHVSCTLPEVFQYVRPGEPVLLDDGKIEGVVARVDDGEIHIDITHARENGDKLRADKGINFPESALGFRGLTDKDREDLAFVAQYADVVNFSFVNTPRDVQDLLDELDRLKAKDLGIILKIETQRGYDNLPAILLTAMRRHPLGVMVARGDLAIEVGWKNLAEIQEEILALCEAAHIPVVWATQVLETLAKKGRPSRAEISDAAMAQQAECVMLNKGPHIVEAIAMLGEILSSMERHHEKKAPIKSVLRLASLSDD